MQGTPPRNPQYAGVNVAVVSVNILTCNLLQILPRSSFTALTVQHVIKTNSHAHAHVLMYPCLRIHRVEIWELFLAWVCLCVRMRVCMRFHRLRILDARDEDVCCDYVCFM
jgi:hypothetical protein